MAALFWALMFHSGLLITSHDTAPSSPGAVLSKTVDNSDANARDSFVSPSLFRRPKTSRNYFTDVTLKCRLSFELARGCDDEDDICAVNDGKQLMTRRLVI